MSVLKKIQVSGRLKQGLFNIINGKTRPMVDVTKHDDAAIDEIAKRSVDDLFEQEVKKKIKLSTSQDKRGFEKTKAHNELINKSFSLDNIDEFYNLFAKYDFEHKFRKSGIGSDYVTKILVDFRKMNKDVDMINVSYIEIFSGRHLGVLNNKLFDIAKKIFDELRYKGLARTFKENIISARYKNYLLLFERISEFIIIVKLNKALQELAVEYDPKYPERMHPSVQKDIEKQQSLYGKHPSFPKMSPQDKQHFAELLTSKRFKEVLEKIRKYAKDAGMETDDISELAMWAMGAIQQVNELEKTHRKELETLAIRLAMEDNNVKPGDLLFDAKLIDMKMPQGGQQQQAIQIPAVEIAQELQDVDLEVAKRRFINGLIHGASEKGQYLFHFAEEKLKQIDPDLPAVYGLIQAMGDFFIWFPIPQGASGEDQGVEGGKSKIEKVGNKWRIIARAINFPLLLNELVKGIMEVMSMHGLPKDKSETQRVLKKADFLDAEIWDRRFGPGLWERFVDAIGADDRDVRSHLYAKVVSMPAQDFHELMQQLMSGSKNGRQKLADLAKEIKDDIRSQDAGDALKEDVLAKRAIDILLEDEVKKKIPLDPKEKVYYKVFSNKKIDDADYNEILSIDRNRQLLLFDKIAKYNEIPEKFKNHIEKLITEFSADYSNHRRIPTHRRDYAKESFKFLYKKYPELFEIKEDDKKSLLNFANSEAASDLYDSEFIKLMKTISAYYHGALPNLENKISKNGRKLACYGIVTGKKYIDKYLSIISNTVNGPYIYAMYVVEQPIPEFEENISKNIQNAVSYAAKFNRRSKPIEQRILKIMNGPAYPDSTNYKLAKRYLRKFKITTGDLLDIQQ